MAAPTLIEQDAQRVLAYLVRRQDDSHDTVLMEIAPLEERATGLEIASAVDIAPARVNDAVSLLETNGQVETIKTFGTSPYTFNVVRPTPLGRLEHQRASPLAREPIPVRDDAASEVSDLEGLIRGLADQLSASPRRYATPIGSPYGFEEEDWEYVESERTRTDRLKVVVGLQFNSPTFERPKLMNMLRRDFKRAIAEYNREPGHESVALTLRGLRAGYGEHLFNEIARDVISADIAVFETSDRNLNVMIEMGVALTWGRRVLPIKKRGRQKPPSDISGQTWADYDARTYRFADEDHHDNLVAMVRRVHRRKVSGA